ncbi:MAG TPA: hypothetical protein VFG25_05425 [Nitrosopumilaceae archaeon]|nr:hypothetical protein [Nitrosopumilaceae archaeon]
MTLVRNYTVRPNNGKDSLFSAGKPKRVPKWYFPIVIGIIAALVIFYNSV